MLVYMIAVAVQVASRTASTSSEASFTQSLEMIAANQGLYLASLSAGIASSILLIVLAAGLYPSFRDHQPYLAMLGSSLFLAAALTWLVSAASGVALASLAREFAAASGTQAEIVAGDAQVAELIREATGRTGFTLAGLGTLSLGGLIARRSLLPKWLGWLGVLVGISMLFIWYDSAAVLHRIGGSGYLVWLLLTGGWLVAKGTRPSLERN